MVPAIVTDGDLSVAVQNGAPVPNFPFAYRGDTKTFVAKVTMRVDVNDYKVPVPMSQRWFPGLGRGYLVDFDQPSAVGQQLIEYGELYASVPLTGVEYGSATTTLYQAVVAPPDQNSTLTQYSDTFDALRLFEYSIFKPLPELIAPRLFLQSVGGFDRILQTGDTNPLSNGKILAQNTTTRLYAGKIYERLSVLIVPAYPRFAQLL